MSSLLDIFKPQLAADIGDLKEPMTFPKLASKKLDGIRLSTVEGGVLTRSRKEPKNKFVREWLQPFQHLDGEIVVGEPTDADCYSKTQSFVNSKENAPVDQVTFYAFDDLTDLTKTFRERQLTLMSRMAMIRTNNLHIIQLPQLSLNSDDDVVDFYMNNLELGFEGAILRNPDSLYRHGRSTAKSQNMLKMKPHKDSECEIIEVFEALHNENEAFINELGRTYRSSHQENKTGLGMAGGFIVRDIHTGVVFRCSVGSFTHAERVWIWENREACKGKILVYRFMDYGVKAATGIPRMPRAKGWRERWDL